MIRLDRRVSGSAILGLLLGCGGRAFDDPAGASVAVTGGQPNSGTVASGSGGRRNSGGTPGVGGRMGSGGVLGSGGAFGVGGHAGSGGLPNSSGGVGGAPFIGGNPNAGGAGAVAGMAGMPAGGVPGTAGAAGMSVHPMPSCRGLATHCGPNNNEDCCTSLLVPGGTFNRSNDPLYPATVSDFRLDKYEVTVGRFRKFVEAYDGWRAAGHPLAGEGEHPLIPGTGWDPSWNANLPADAAELGVALKCPDSYFPYTFYTWVDVPGVEETRPINCVTWYEAFMFCAWDGGRLPTEAEWEYAAAGGDEQRVYPWGNTEPGTDGRLASYDCYGSGDMMCRPSDVSRAGLSPEGNARWGQADVAGNVWEWSFDRAGPYVRPCVNCTNEFELRRAIRGGAWDWSTYEMRGSSRGLGLPETRLDNAGARCAR